MTTKLLAFAAAATLLAAPVTAQVASPQNAAMPAGARLPDGAQDGAPRRTEPTGQAAARTASPEEQALEREGQAFGQRMQTLAAAVAAVQARTDLDETGKRREIDAAVAAARADADAFATRVETFMRSQGTEAATEAAAVGATIRSVPEQVSAGVAAGAQASQQAGAQAGAGAPSSPAQTPPSTPQ